MRYFCLVLVLLCSLTACQTSSQPPPAVNHDQIIHADLLRDLTTASWPMFGNNPARTGAVASIPQPPVLKGSLLWSRKLSPIFSSSVAGLGMVYIASTDGYLYALKQESGAMVWRANVRSYLSDATPALAGQVIFVATHGTAIMALDALSGHIYWSYDTREKIQSPPLAVRGRVLIASRTTLWSLDAASGQLRWKFHRGADNWPTLSAPTLIGDTVYFGPGSEDRVWALRFSDGGVRWSFNTGDRIMSAVLGDAGTVYVATWHGIIFALDSNSGSLHWHFTLNQVLRSSVIDGVGGSMALADGRLYIGDYRGTVLCLDALRGQSIWRFATGGQVLGTPIVAAGVVYIGSDDGNFYALDTRSGRPYWRYQTGDARSSASFVDNHLYIGSISGVMYAFR